MRLAASTDTANRRTSESENLTCRIPTRNCPWTPSKKKKKKKTDLSLRFRNPRARIAEDFSFYSTCGGEREKERELSVVELMDEAESSGSSPPSVGDRKAKKESVRVKRETLQAVLEQCQQALQLLSSGEVEEDGDEGVGDGDGDGDGAVPEVGLGGDGLATPHSDCEADELCNLLKSRVECLDFLKKLESAQVSTPHNGAEEDGTWDMVSEGDLWEGENLDPSEQDYVVVREEDIVEGIACYMAAYLLSLKQTKELTPNQLQEALCKTFSVKRKKGKLRKAWEGSRVIYNVASWGATAIGIYQNPVILQAASKAIQASCQVISKLL